MLDQIEGDNYIHRACNRFAQNGHNVTMFDATNSEGSGGSHLFWRTINAPCVGVTGFMHDVEKCSMATSKVQNLRLPIAGKVSLNDPAEERQTPAKSCNGRRCQLCRAARHVPIINPLSIRAP